MKNLLLLIFVCLSVAVYSQTKTPFATTSVPVSNRYAWTNNGLWVDSNIRFLKYRSTIDTTLIGFNDSGYAYKITKTQIQGWSTTDTSSIASKIWVNNNFYTKTQSDNRYLQSYTETDPIWTSDKPNYLLSSTASSSYVSLSGSYTNPSWLVSIPFSKITSTPTTISGYGITDYNTLWDTRLALKTTDNLTEGSVNLYYTSTRFNAAFSAKSTTDLSEGTNQYFTNSRARGAISVTPTSAIPITYNSSTGVFTYDSTQTHSTGYNNGLYLTINAASSGYQPLNTYLTTISGLSPVNDDILQYKSGAWVNRTIAQLKTDLNYTKSDIGLSNVENTALSTWAGSANLTTLGTVTTGTWNGTALSDTYISSASTWNGKAASGANTDITSVLLNQTGLVVKGATSTALTIKPNETYTSARTLNLILNDASRTITLGGNITTAGNFTTSGAFALTLTASATTNATFPSGTVTLLGSTGGTVSSNGITFANTVPLIIGAAGWRMKGSSGTGDCEENIETGGYFRTWKIKNSGGTYITHMELDQISASAGAETAKFMLLNGCRLVVGSTSSDASAAIQINSTTQGLMLPRMTTAQRDAISAGTGLEIFCTDCTANDASTGVSQTYNGSTWKNHY